MFYTVCNDYFPFSYYKMLAICLPLYSTSLSSSYTQCFVPLTPLFLPHPSQLKPLVCFLLDTEIYREGLALMIMEAEKSHSLLSASWRLREASGVVPISKPSGPRMRAGGRVGTGVTA